MHAMLGTVVGNYRVLAKISEGGMGAVYRAEHVKIGKAAAIKVLLPALSSDREAVQRFLTEARAAARLQHPGIVEVFDFGELPSGQAYLVMQLLDGEPLSRRLRTRRALTEVEAARIGRAVCAALAAAHDKGIVHRDLKADNVFLVPDPEVGERPVLLDFGIAKLAEAHDAPGSVTRTGSVIGTPMYMAPEQCRGGDIDHRADLYAVGCLLYEMVCGRPPFASHATGELLGAHQYLAPDPPRVHAPAISVELEALILRLLAKHPGDRVQTAAAVAELLGVRAGAASAIDVEATTMGTAPAPPELEVVDPSRTVPGRPRSRPVEDPAPAEVVASGRAVAARPTTLGSGTGQRAAVTLAPARRRTRIAAIAIAAAVAGVALMFGLAPSSRSTPAQPTPTSHPVAPLPVAPLPAAPVPTAPSPVPAATPAAATPAAAIPAAPLAPAATTTVPVTVPVAAPIATPISEPPASRPRPRKKPPDRPAHAPTPAQRQVPMETDL